MQTPDEYEGASGEKLQAIPMGERGVHPAATTGVELSFAIHTSAALEIKALTGEEVEARQREEEAAAAAAAKKRREEERAKAKKRAHRLSKALKQCRKVKSHHRRAQCVNRAKSRYGAHP